MADDMQELKAQMEVISQQLNSLNRNLSNVVSAIKGNDLTNDGGMIGDLKALQTEMLKIDNRITVLEKVKERIYWTMGIITTVGGFLGNYAAQILMFIRK